METRCASTAYTAKFQEPSNRILLTCWLLQVSTTVIALDKSTHMIALEQFSRTRRANDDFVLYYTEHRDWRITTQVVERTMAREEQSAFVYAVCTNDNFSTLLVIYITRVEPHHFDCTLHFSSFEI